MKIAIAQLQPLKGAIESNIAQHKKLIQLAVKNQADAIFFPELSVTSYEPELAKQLVLQKDDSIFSSFQEISDQHNLLIGVGAPTPSASDIYISLLIFQAFAPITIYHKQQLHEDELPFFVSGNEQLIIQIKKESIAPAICYESLQANHAAQAVDLGATIYLASVAKAQKGIEKAKAHYPQIAKQYQLPVLMANCVGSCDNFVGAGQSAVWNTKGEMISQLSPQQEGIIIYDTEKESTQQVVLAG